MINIRVSPGTRNRSVLSKISSAGVAVIEGTPNLIEHLGEYALVHCDTSSGTQFIVKTNDLDKICKGTLSGFFEATLGLHVPVKPAY